MGRKTENGVPMESGAVVVSPCKAADPGDTTTVHLTLTEAGLAVAELVGREAELYSDDTPKVNVDRVGDLLTDNGLYKGTVVEPVKKREVSAYIPEKRQASKRN